MTRGLSGVEAGQNDTGLQQPFSRLDFPCNILTVEASTKTSKEPSSAWLDGPLEDQILAALPPL
jgi:hypothetical protein